MDRSQLAAWLGLTVLGVQELVAAGMPVRRDGRFDPYIVAEWIESKGLGARCEHRGTVSTLGEVAKAFGVSLSTVKKDWRPSGMPGQARAYNLAEIAEWKRLRTKDPQPDGGGTSPANDDLRRRLAADVRIREAEALRKERENKIEEGQILRRDNVQRAFAELIIATRTAFTTLPRKMMPRFPKAEAADLTAELLREVESILKAMAEWRPTWKD